ncbi:MAG: hypothetical protein AB2988_00205 [Candidatus Symbiodolus clandestinus]
MVNNKFWDTSCWFLANPLRYIVLQKTDFNMGILDQFVKQSKPTISTFMLFIMEKLAKNISLLEAYSNFPFANNNWFEWRIISTIILVIC